MIKVNENYFKLQNSYLFSTIAQKVEKFTKENPDKKIIKLGIGDVTLPIVPKVGEAIKKATDEMLNKDTFKGYGPEQGYLFLREKIVEYDYKAKGIDIKPDEIFISDGAKCDTGNIGELFSLDNKVAITDPVYPVYLDTNVMAGRTGKFDEKTGKYENVVYMPVTSENNFVPELPNEPVDMIYLCLPNNPTGTVLTKEQLQVWVDYATKKGAIILFDAAYEAFITEPDIPHSIYEIPGAKKVAIEFKSFSKTAGFTGVRCAYTVVPKELEIYSGPLKTVTGESPTGDPNVDMYKLVRLNELWNRRQCTKFNGVAYITQRAAEAVYTEEGRAQINENIKYYRENARIILEGLQEAGYEVYGGKNAPYIWLKVPDGMTSWEFFDYLLEKAGVVGTPGAGFGPSGEGYFRLTAFGTKESTIEAIERIKNM